MCSSSKVLISSKSSVYITNSWNCSKSWVKFTWEVLCLAAELNDAFFSLTNSLCIRFFIFEILPNIISSFWKWSLTSGVAHGDCVRMSGMQHSSEQPLKYCLILWEKSSAIEELTSSSGSLVMNVISNMLLSLVSWLCKNELKADYYYSGFKWNSWFS